MSGTIHKELRPLIKEACKQGCTVVQTKRLHIKITCPGGHVVMVGGTPSNTWRARKNLISDLRRGGVEFGGKS